MFKSLRNTSIAHLPILTVILIAVVIAWQSIIPNTYLSGWDTLHPEFDLGLYFERTFFGAWQEHQGLGAPASQAHTAEITRLPLMWLLSIVLPEWAVRHAFFSSMYVVGGIGSYLFITKVWFKEKNKSLKNWAGVIGAIFYLTNLATVQQFYVPLEMFAIHFASIGFVLWSFHHAIVYGKKKHFFWLFLIQILSTGIAHTATLFYATMLGVGIYAFFLASIHTFSSKKTTHKYFLNLVLAVLISLAANFFWLSTNFYYIFNHSSYVSDAKISRLFSGEAFWQNQAFGNVKDVIIFKNFLFNWKDYNFNQNEFTPLLDEWNEHLYTNDAISVSYLLSITALIGLIISFIDKKKRSQSIPLAALLLLSSFFIINLNWPTEKLFTLLQNVSVLEEALRFPFTKFSILLSFSMSVFLSNAVYWFLTFFDEQDSKIQQTLFSAGFLILLLFASLWSVKPLFYGNLISGSMKVQYPNYYKDFYQWSKTIPRENRMVKLPLTSFWGWNYHSWPVKNTNQGYQGAGFFWFGFQQPVLDREFDRWVNTNEFFYYELNEAVRTKNQKLFTNILKKYNINYIVNDKSIFQPNAKTSQQLQDEFELLVNNNDQINKTNNFGLLDVYSLKDITNDWVTSKKVFKTQSLATNVRTDVIYQNNGNYISDHSFNTIYPFAELHQEKLNPNLVSVAESKLTFTKNIVVNAISELAIPPLSIFNETSSVDVFIEKTNEDEFSLKLTKEYPEIFLNDKLVFSKKPTELTYLLPTTDFEKNIIVEIDTNFLIVELEEITKTKHLGTLLLDLNSLESLKIYPLQPTVVSEIPTSTFYPCDTNATKIIESDDILNLESDTIDCQNTVLANSFETNGLLEVQYTHISPDAGTISDVCLSFENSNDCLNQEFKSIPSQTSEITSAQYVSIDDNDDSIKVSLEVNNNKTTLGSKLSSADSPASANRIKYKNVTQSFRPLLDEIDISELNENEFESQPKKIMVDEGKSELKISLPISNSFVADFTVQSAYRNCNPNVGEVSVEQKNSSFIYHASNEAIGCESIFFPGITDDLEYVFGITGENTYGKSLKFYLKSSNTDETIIEENIEKTKEEVSSNFYTIPNGRETKGLDLHLENTSYGSIDTINSIQESSFYQAPLSWISNFEIVSENETYLQPLEVANYQRHFNWLYSASVSSEYESSLQLLQSFDNGWLAMVIESDGKNYILLNNHYRYNSWANAWLVPEGNHKIIIFYWPQLLSFAGYAILVLFGGWFVRVVKIIKI